MRTALLFSALLSSFLAIAQQPPYLNILPKPEKITFKEGVCPIDRDRVVDASEPWFRDIKKILAEEIGASIDTSGLPSGKQLIIEFRPFDAETIEPPEAYWIEVNAEDIILAAGSAEGFYRGTRTLVQLLGDKPIGTPLPCMTIEDKPRFAWRGMHLDVCRHFFPVDFVKRYIDLLARYKMNTFHWHLTDDQGWRIEIKKHPALTDVGAWRKGSQVGPYSRREYDSIPYGGFYTQAEIKEVVRYAQERHITVVPEIEMPGHALAALAAYPHLGCTGGPYEVQKGWGVFDDVFCGGKDPTFLLLEDVLTEVMELFPGEYIHIGGDECPKERWKTCAHCQARMKTEGLKDEHELQSYFIQRIEKFVNAKGRKIIGWDEILEGGLAPNAAVMSWRGTEGGTTAAQQQHPVVMCPGSHCYFDHYQGDPAYEPLAIGGFTTVQKVYSYEPVPAALTAEQAKYILGAQGNIWTEYILSQEHVQYMALPRMIALAEVLWSPKEQRNEADFVRRLEGEFRTLSAKSISHSKSLYNVAFKLGSSKKRGQVNIDLVPPPVQGEVHYTTDNTEPMISSPLFNTPIEQRTSGTVRATLFRDGIKVGNATSRAFKFNIATGQAITVNPAPHERYNDGGKFALVDGITAGDKRVNHEWLGWRDERVTITVDLGTEQWLTRMELGSLMEPHSWIHAPWEVEVSISSDGTSFTPLDSPKRPADAKGRVQYRCSIPMMARFVRFVAKGVERIPEGNAGAGEVPWLFLDEITIE